MTSYSMPKVVFNLTSLVWLNHTIPTRPPNRKHEMTKLLAAYRSAPTDANRARLVKHIAKHPFSLCLLDVQEQAFLRANGFSV